MLLVQGGERLREEWGRKRMKERPFLDQLQFIAIN